MVAAAPVPVVVRALGRRFAEFFTGQLANPHTRLAFARAVRRLCDWCEARGLALVELEPIGAAAYLEDAKRALSLPTLKQHLSALRRLFDWWVAGGVLQTNPLDLVRPLVTFFFLAAVATLRKPIANALHCSTGFRRSG